MGDLDLDDLGKLLEVAEASAEHDPYQCGWCDSDEQLRARQRYNDTFDRTTILRLLGRLRLAEANVERLQEAKSTLWGMIEGNG